MLMREVRLHELHALRPIHGCCRHTRLCKVLCDLVQARLGWEDQRRDRVHGSEKEWTAGCDGMPVQCRHEDT